MQAVLYLVIEDSLLQTLLNDFIESVFVFDSMHFRTIGNIVIDGFRKRIRTLEYHADIFSKRYCITIPDILSFEEKASFNPTVWNQVIHSVHTAEKC